ncbi:MAG TPA: hypothetical protein VG253_04280 [Streptosporangiaceae bacterium]|jgi:peptide chain release factor subunit 1|nr:hypothetical protein [Streptosporangiaceae bacterium]
MLTAETIDSIVHFNAGRLPVTSLYARVDTDPGQREDLHSRVTSLLDSELHPLADDPALDHDSRMSLRGDMDRIRDVLGEERWTPGAIAIFACHGRGLFEQVSLPRALRDRLKVDAAPYVRPLLTVLDEYHRAVVAVVDRAEAKVWEIYQDEMTEVTKFRDRALRKPNYAYGDAEYSVRNKAGELGKRHYRKVAQLLADMFRNGEFDLLIVAGHEYEVPAFTDFLPSDLKPRVAGTFTIDPSTAPLAEIRKNADAVLERYERDAERQLVSDVLETVAAGGLAVAGLDQCLWAGSVAAAQTLLIQEGAATQGVVCDQSHWLARSGDTCPICGRETRRTPDVIDELAQAAIDESATVKHIHDDSRLDPYLTAAALRFPLPPLPAG